MTLPTPCYLIDETRLRTNLETIARLRERSGAKALLALKCFAGWSVFPLMREYLDGTTSSSLNEVRLGHEKFGGETHGYSVAWAPGEVTEADGGKVDGTKVSFNDGDSHQVKGKDKAAAGATPSSSQESTGKSSSTPTWARLLMGAIPAAAIGGGVAVAMSQRKKKQQTQLGPYATPAQGYDPNQALFSQPGQPYQPGDAGPAPQPYQQPYNGQPGQFGQPDQGL